MAMLLAPLLRYKDLLSFALFLIMQFVEAMPPPLRLTCDKPEERVIPECGSLAGAVSDFGKTDEDLR